MQNREREHVCVCVSGIHMCACNMHLVCKSERLCVVEGEDCVLWREKRAGYLLKAKRIQVVV